MVHHEGFGTQSPCHHGLRPIFDKIQQAGLMEHTCVLDVYEGFCEGPTWNRCVCCSNASTPKMNDTPIATTSGSRFGTQKHRGMIFLCEIRLIECL
jgi:hypothetical protein